MEEPAPKKLAGHPRGSSGSRLATVRCAHHALAWLRSIFKRKGRAKPGLEQATL